MSRAMQRHLGRRLALVERPAVPCHRGSLHCSPLARFCSTDLGASPSPSAPSRPAAPPCFEGSSEFEHRWLPSSADGMLIYCGIWGSGDICRPRGIVVYVHGFGSHVHDPRGFQENILVPLWQRDYAVWGFDARGQGRTGKAAGQFGDIGEGEERMADFATVLSAVTEQFPHSPVFIMGHGLGGSEALAFMSLRGSSSEGQAVRGLALLAPAAKMSNRVPILLRFIMKMESLRGTTHMHISDLWKPSLLSKDISDARLTGRNLDMLFQSVDLDGSGLLDMKEFEQAINMELGMGLSPEEVQATFNRFDSDSDGRISIEELITHISAHHPEDDYCLKAFKVNTDFDWYSTAMDPAKIDVPMLLVHGRRDKVDRFEDAVAFLNAATSKDKTLKAFDNLRHGVAMDMDAPLVLEELTHWLDARTASE